MGIRIHKKMGWIIKDIEFDIEVLSRKTLDKLLTENPADDQLEIDILPAEVDKSLTLDSFVQDVGGDEENIWIFIPPFGTEDWSRYDDSMDYIEANGVAETKIQYIHQELFPYRGRFVVTKTLTELNDKNKFICSSNVNPDNFENWYKKELENLGLNLSHGLREQIHMKAPRVIELIFNELQTGIDFKRLRPAIISYWC